MLFWQFRLLPAPKKQGTVPRLCDITRFPNILSAYSGNTFFAKKGTLGEDFGTSYVSPFIVSLAPMPSSMVACLDVFTATSNVWWEQRASAMSTTYRLSYGFLAVSARRTVYCAPPPCRIVLRYSTLCCPWANHLLLYEHRGSVPSYKVLHVYGGGRTVERQSVCLHACSVCVCRTLCRALPSL